VKRLPTVCLVALALLCAALVAGCGSSVARQPVANPYSSLQTPGPPPAARSGSQVWAVGMPTLVVASANGGATWQTGRASTIGDPFTQVLYAVAFADARQGWAVGKSGLILSTSDGGSHWAVSHRDVPDVCLRGVAAIGRHTAVAVGYARSTALGLIVVTADGGTTWQTRYAGPDVLRAVAFADARHGWAVGSKGILVTADGGAHWRLQRAVSSFYGFAAVTFADARHGWAVGGTGDAPAEPGFVMTTRDGGVHWTTTLLSGAVDRLNGVSFVDALHGWVVGNRGVVYRTRDGGRSWVLSHVNAYWELGAVAFSDARHGWAIVHPHWTFGASSSGDSQRGWGLLRQLDLLTTSDGGVTWSAVKTADGIASPVILTAVTCRDVPD
jgi:photosystem II stability/assembly factor-like uncharacterized protein